MVWDPKSQEAVLASVCGGNRTQAKKLKWGDGYEEKLLTKAISTAREPGKGKATQRLAAAKTHHHLSVVLQQPLSLCPQCAGWLQLGWSWLGSAASGRIGLNVRLQVGIRSFPPQAFMLRLKLTVNGFFMAESGNSRRACGNVPCRLWPWLRIAHFHLHPHSTGQSKSHGQSQNEWDKVGNTHSYE